VIDRKKRQDELSRAVFDYWIEQQRTGDKSDRIVVYTLGIPITIVLYNEKSLNCIGKQLQFFEEIIGDGSWL
jgi:hypothetical protein